MNTGKYSNRTSNNLKKHANNLINNNNKLVRNSRKQEKAQKYTTALFCSIVAVFMICSVIFGSSLTQAAPAETTYKYYTSLKLEQGDTLWNIAKEYISDEYKDTQAYIEEVCAINHIAADEIHAGQYIVVPYYSSDVLE